MVISVIFAVICLGVAITGFTSLGNISNPTEAADARGFAWFWTFLGGVALAFGFLAWRIARNTKHDEGA
jgi:hypothetical protein